MSAPEKFSWIERPHLAAMARPAALIELVWLRAQGIQLLISLTETPLRRDWVNDAGLMAVHVPVVDLTAPTPEQFEHCLEVIRRAHEQKFGVGIHCAAGLGRTGTLLAVWYVDQGLDAATAIAKVREIRPGSIETPEQERAVHDFRRSGKEKTSEATTVERDLSKTALSRIDESFEQAARLSGSELNPSEFYLKFIGVVVDGIQARAGAIWLRTKQGFLHLETQQNIENIGWDRDIEGRKRHNELLRQAFRMGRPMLLEPYGTSGVLEGLPAANPTESFCLLSPIMIEKGIWGLLELWTEQRFDVRMQRTFLNYLVQMSGYAAKYIRRNNLSTDA